MTGRRHPDPDERWQVELIQRSRRLRSVPDDVLTNLVTRDGACMDVRADGQPPRWLHGNGADRELAARLCQGCPVPLPCLEQELRLSGEHTVGVWGALDEDTRRALFPRWSRQRVTDQGQPTRDDGGEL
jgi:WhiB family transcriptional regulator, redox-sensing transcriptional regulator